MFFFTFISFASLYVNFLQISKVINNSYVIVRFITYDEIVYPVAPCTCARIAKSEFLLLFVVIILISTSVCYLIYLYLKR